MIGKIPKDKYSVSDISGVKVITAKFWDVSENLVGTFLDESNYDFVVDEDCDFYAPPKCDIVKAQTCDKNCNNCSNEDDIMFKLRRGVFTEAEQLGAYEGLVGAAQPTQNRGMAAGPKSGKLGNRLWVTSVQDELMMHFINPKANVFGEDPVEEIINKYKGKEAEIAQRGQVWMKSKVVDSGYDYETFFNDKLEEWKLMDAVKASKDAARVNREFISDTTYANSVNSGIAGFFDRYPRIPYGRATSYTENNYDDFEKCYPFMRKLANEFQRLLPRRFSVQQSEANKLDERFRVAGKDTPFTTITVNKNFRTAAHRDAGDLHEGFSNLTVVAKDKVWSGGYLVLPEFRVAIKLLPGDLLLINNHAGIHGNTEILPPPGKTIEDMERISLVCYFREKMLELGSWEYEHTRKSFVEERRHNKDHPEWRHLWNGVGVGMFTSQEWYDYLQKALGRDALVKYHPEAGLNNGSLLNFFE